MTNSKQIKFKIDHLDPLGQGVYKREDQVYFIPKTLPGESGSAIVKKSRKGVHFAALTELIDKSSQRTLPQCKHYQKCQGCSYLHMEYSDELNFKKLALAKHLSRVTHPEIELYPCGHRFGYRNRIQLHYNKKQHKLGYIDSYDKSILNIEHCPLGNEKVQKIHKQLLASWVSLVPGHSNQGHVEIDANGIHWNESYSHGGFTQVNDEINQVLTELVASEGNAIAPTSVLDLFSGRGNLSHKISCQNKTLIDYSNYDIPNYFAMDLYSENTLYDFSQKMGPKKFDLIIIDPPRKGFFMLGQWLEKFPSKRVIYVSCNPATLTRDLQSITSGVISSVKLLDMFPGTHHFETLVSIDFKN